MIEAFTGLPGHGKTYDMSVQALKVIRKGKKKVYANYPLEGSIYYQELNEVLNVKNAIILIDEAGVYLDAVNWKVIPWEFKLCARQHRHDALHIWYTAQDLKDTAAWLRRITQFVHEHERFWKFVKVSTYNPRNKSKYGSRFMILDKEVFKAYDTNYLVNKPEYLDVKA